MYAWMHSFFYLVNLHTSRELYGSFVVLLFQIYEVNEKYERLKEIQ